MSDKQPSSDIKLKRVLGGLCRSNDDYALVVEIARQLRHQHSDLNGALAGVTELLLALPLATFATLAAALAFSGAAIRSAAPVVVATGAAPARRAAA